MLILTGPSASGKTVIAKSLIKNHNMKKLVTYTTRPLREGEVNGVDYHFVSVQEFKQLIAKDFFFETVLYNHNYYGTAISDITPDKVVILEPTGLKQYLAKMRDKVKVCFLSCPKEIRFERMIKRGDSLEVIERRLANDDAIFNEEISSIADWVIPGEYGTADEQAQIIYNLYTNARKREQHENR